MSFDSKFKDSLWR